jgi:oxygen-independent coproporphyrinogen-3 oxidase
MTDAIDQVTPDLLSRHNRSGPRYTSYPTAPVWDAHFSTERWHTALTQLRSPASVYVHLPFCKEQCSFCGCNMVVSGRKEVGERYLRALETELAALPLPTERVSVRRIHLGGGTPTWHSADELEQLHELLLTRFEPTEGAELSIEADPEVTTNAQLERLFQLGWNRLSLGVQSFDPTVLAAVNRPQQHTRVHDILSRCREAGLTGLNVDLIYGLPHQTAARFRDTLEKTVAMRPDRLAVYSYAHVPWLRSHMKRMDEGALPTVEEKFALFALALRVLTDNGYRFIGMDHFALEEDALSVAQREGRLHRNFMGYTTDPDLDVIGLGTSAISEVDGVFAQNRSKLATYYQALEGEEPPIEKGYAKTKEDRLRADVIAQLMCNFRVVKAEIARDHNVDFDRHFGPSRLALEAAVAQGLLEDRPDALQVTALGRFFVRNIAMAFDAYLGASNQPRFSQTI